MRSKFFIAAICILCTIQISAQQKTFRPQESFRFQSLTQLGALCGSSNMQFLVETINGIKYNNLFAGAGVGMDFYFVRSVPVFIELRRNIFNKGLTPFVYADAGINFPWINDPGTKYKHGGYYDLGAGYNFPVKKSVSIFLSLGYNIKKLSGYKTEPSFYPMPYFPWSTSDKAVRYDYELRRIAVKAGLSF